MRVGIPVKLMYEGLGHTVSIELKNGELYRGILSAVSDNMNCLMNNVTLTSRDGKTTSLEQVYIRGAQLRIAIFPDMLRHAPMFKLAQGTKARRRGLGVGTQRRAMAMRARAGTAMYNRRRGGRGEGGRGDGGRGERGGGGGGGGPPQQ